MSKFAVDSHRFDRPGHNTWRPLRIALMVLIVAVVTPLVVECASACYAQWSVIVGKSASVRTPILDGIHESWALAREDVVNSISSHWSRFPRSTTTVLAVTTVSIVIGMFVLRLPAHPTS